MLSRDERRELAGIERRLRVEDPALARRLARGPGARRRWVVPLLVTAATLCVALGLGLSEVGALISGFVLFGVVVLIRRRRRRRQNPRA